MGIELAIAGAVLGGIAGAGGEKSKSSSEPIIPSFALPAFKDNIARAQELAGTAAPIAPFGQAVNPQDDPFASQSLFELQNFINNQVAQQGQAGAQQSPNDVGPLDNSGMGRQLVEQILGGQGDPRFEHLTGLGQNTPRSFIDSLTSGDFSALGNLGSLGNNDINALSGGNPSQDLINSLLGGLQPQDLTLGLLPTIAR